MRHTITVAGGGSWGTALAHLLAVRGHRTRLWLRDAAVAGAINSRHENPRYLPGLALHPGLEAGTDPGLLCARARGRLLPQEIVHKISGRSRRQDPRREQPRGGPGCQGTALRRKRAGR